MKLENLAGLFFFAKSGRKRTLVAMNATEGHTLEAVAEAVKMGLVFGVLTGNRNEINRQCGLLGVDPEIFEIIDAQTEEDAVESAVAQVRKTPESILMKGLISSDKFMRAILNKENGLLPEGNILSHVCVVENSAYHKLLIASDVAIIPYPNLKQKIALTNYLKQVAINLGIDRPKVAIIAPTEQILPSLPACADAVELMKVAATGSFDPAIVYGPIALDVAIDKESADIKNVVSEVAGDADCLLFPNIDAGNVFYKMNAKLCNAQQAAIVMGAKIPVVLSSRGDSMQTKLNSIALAGLIK